MRERLSEPGGGAVEIADDEGGRQDHGGALHFTEQHQGGDPPLLLDRLVDRGERRPRQRGLGDVVDADDGDVARDGYAQIGERGAGGKGDGVGHRQQRRRPGLPPQQCRDRVTGRRRVVQGFVDRHF